MSREGNLNNEGIWMLPKELLIALQSVRFKMYRLKASSEGWIEKGLAKVSMMSRLQVRLNLLQDVHFTLIDCDKFV